MKYRADIDGLRAVAVLAVMAFHAGILKMSGGFVGVDVFFVISGYLLSAIVFADVAASRFSIIDFYERRIRRIFPALFAMLIVFTVFASVYFFPTVFVEYGRSLLASTTFASNFYFWKHSGYFDSSSSNPLLHTWSLAIEEQFYILFPLLCIMVRRLSPQRLRTSVIVLFLSSLLASAVMVYYDQVNAFYMIYTRAWELLLGTVLSLGLFPRLRSALSRNLITILGIGLIAYSVFVYSDTTRFPGLSAVVPCAGAALIIGAGESGMSLVGAVLSWRPVAFVGLISYSLYLWHWPVIILHEMGVLFSRDNTLASLFLPIVGERRYDKIVEIGVPFVLAILSWRFVEIPFRSGRLRLRGRPLFMLAGSVMVVFVAISLLTITAQGFAKRFPPEAVQIASYPKNGSSEAKRVNTCFITTTSRFEDYQPDRCLHRDAGKKSYLVLGDSHSAALWPGLSLSLPDANMMQASTVGCAPFVETSSSSPASDCRKMMNFIFRTYLPAHPVQALFLVARWQSKDIGKLAATLDWANRHKIAVVLFGPVPEYDVPLPLLLGYSITWNQPELASRHMVSERKTLDLKLQLLARTTWRVPYISLYGTVCHDGECAVYGDEAHKVPLLSDDNHLSTEGSFVVSQRLLAEGKLPST